VTACARRCSAPLQDGSLPPVDTAIAIGEGAGVALACGITAAVPLAIAAIAALLFGLPGDRSQLDDGWLVALACVLAGVIAAAEARLPARGQSRA
jgi:hypothetical protein